jgi:hypothetical protein
MRQSTRNQVPITTQKILLFAIPEIETQRSLAGLRGRFIESYHSLQSRISSAKQLRQRIMEAAIV